MADFERPVFEDDEPGIMMIMMTRHPHFYHWTEKLK